MSNANGSDPSPPSDYRADGLRNVLTGMGLAARDPSMSTAPTLPGMDPQILTLDELWALYRTDTYARRTVDLPEQHATRRGWTVDVGYEEESPQQEALEREADRVRVTATARQAARFAAIEGAGCVVVVTPDDEQDQPLERVRELRGLRAYRGHELYPHTSAGVDDMGEPLMYELRRPDGTTALLHPSRVASITGARVPEEYAYSTPTSGRWPYDSRLQAVWPALRVLGVVEQGAERALHQLRVAKMGLPLQAIQERGGEAALMRRLHTLQLGLSTFQAYLFETMAMGGQALESIDFDTLDLRGVVDVLRHFVGKAAAGADMPITLFAGSAPAGLSTDDASGSRNWNAYVRARQVEVYRPVLLRAYTWIAQSLGREEAQDVTFNPLSDPTDSERATIEKTEAETDLLYWQADGLVDPRGRVETTAPLGEEPAP